MELPPRCSTGLFAVTACTDTTFESQGEASVSCVEGEHTSDQKACILKLPFNSSGKACTAFTSIPPPLRELKQEHSCNCWWNRRRSKSLDVIEQKQKSGCPVSLQFCSPLSEYIENMSHIQSNHWNVYVTFTTYMRDGFKIHILQPKQ